MYPEGVIANFMLGPFFHGDEFIAHHRLQFDDHNNIVRFEFLLLVVGKETGLVVRALIERPREICLKLDGRVVGAVHEHP